MKFKSLQSPLDFPWKMPYLCAQPNNLMCPFTKIFMILTLDKRKHVFRMCASSFSRNIKNKNKSNRINKNPTESVSNSLWKHESKHYLKNVFIVKFLNLIRFSDYSRMILCCINRLSLIIMMQKMHWIIYESCRKWKHFHESMCNLWHVDFRIQMG